MNATDPAADDASIPPNRGVRLRRLAPLLVPLTLILVLLGPHLIGSRSLSPADQLYNWQPWAAEAPEDLSPTHNAPFSDNFDALFPTREEAATRIRSGDWPLWSPLAAGGTGLATNIGTAAVAPSNVVTLATPSWYAPALIKALELLAAWGFVFLFLRRVGAGPWPAAFAGVVYALSGFQVVWINWPHTRAAALVAGVLWAVDRVIERVTPERIALAALMVAASVLEGFPAVAVVGIGTVALVLTVRAVQLSSTWRDLLCRVGAAGSAAVIGAALTAVVMLPFATGLRDLGLDRNVPEDAPIARGLGTIFAPNALGPAEQYFGPLNYIEIGGYLGAPAFLLVVAGLVALLTRGRPDRRGVLLGVTGAGGAIMLLYSFGVEPLYDLFRGLPVLSTNASMRVKSAAFLLLALASGLALDTFARSRLPAPTRWICTVALLGATAFIVAYLSGFARLANAELSSYVTGEVVRAIVVAVLAAAAILVLVHRPPWPPASTVAVAALISLAVIDSVAWVLPYWPRSDPDTLYPVTEAHQFLDDELGDDRFGALGLTFFPGTSGFYGLRAVNGHLFHDPTWVEALEAAGATMRSPTFSSFEDPASASSPVLDRMGTTLWADPAGQTRCGGSATEPEPSGASAGATTDSDLRTSVTGPGVRGVTFVPSSTISAGTELRAIATDEVGGEFVGVFTPLGDVPSGQPVTIAIPLLEAVPGVIEILIEPDLGVTPAGGPVACVAPQDGLSLVHASGAWIYERGRALDRVRWAGSAVIEPDAERRLELLASGDLDDDEVLLGDDTSIDTGAATGEIVAVRDDGGDTVWITAESDGTGHVVIADAIQRGWEATVDGESAQIVAADHAGAAVAVDGAGTHEIVLRAEPPGATTGVLVSAAALVVTLGLLAAGMLRRRRGPATVPAGTDPPAPPPESDPDAPR